ncbi:MAG: DUF3570 domain-containing protein [Gammaproteobacteria bacterium]|nr:DUF3570 domain-containing protein [Gammaproteobacteria bacterium]
MQSIKNKLKLATCSLLVTTGNVAAEAIENVWEVDSSYLYYKEDNRVTVNKLVGTAKGYVSPTDTASIKVVFDSMTGATPSGAVKTNSPLTTTGASGGTGVGGSTNAAALSQFDDTRVGVSLDWQHEYNRTFNIIYNGAFSVENDYQSVGGSVTANKETADRSTKFTLGLALTFDTIFRTGTTTTPDPISEVSDDLSRNQGKKATTDLIAGMTNIINARTVTQVNLAIGQVNGYQTDPYKVFSVVDANGIELDQYYEGRPDSRKRWSITTKLNHQLYPNNDNLHLSYRYYSDDWGINSHTVNYRHRFNYTNVTYLEPRLRLYSQSEAKFYRNSFFSSPGSTLVLPQFISADYRLDKMSDVTIGATLGRQFSGDSDLRIRLEYLYQSFKNAEFDTNKAIIFQVSYGKRF